MALKDDIKISIFSLDKATLKQPELYEEWARRWANAVFERDKLKEQLTIKKAEVEENIRLNPEKYGWDNDKKPPTEGWFTMKVNKDKDIKALNQQFISAQYEVNMATGGKETIEHRGRALNILTELYKGNYYAAKSRGDENYTNTVTEKNTDAQTEGLNSNERMKKRVHRKG